MYIFVPTSFYSRPWHGCGQASCVHQGRFRARTSVALAALIHEAARHARLGKAHLRNRLEIVGLIQSDLALAALPGIRTTHRQRPRVASERQLRDAPALNKITKKQNTFVHPWLMYGLPAQEERVISQCLWFCKQGWCDPFHMRWGA